MARERSSEIHFPQGVRVEPHGDETTYVYDETEGRPGSRRYEIQDFVMDWERKEHIRLSLQGQTHRGTWHRLLEVHLAKNADTGELIDMGISVDTISGSTRSGDNITPGVETIYSVKRGGSAREGASSGYYGRDKKIAADLKGLHALAQTPDELPRRIDVPRTALGLVDSFQKGNFEPPPLVTPPSRLSSWRKRLLGGK